MTLAWAAKDEGQGAIWFDWTETGGPTVEEPSHKGFGSTMLRALLKSGHRPDAGMEYRPGGVVCRGGIEKG